MGNIITLDRNMINMIAAGEVIERPASAVKELVENSIDAGATKITVSIEDGGRKLISISDNGRAMDAEDLTKAFETHSTSKIKTNTDLNSITTLGFRGEALASIASVAQVKAVSRTQNSTAANCLEIDCGTKTHVTPCSADYGTTIQIRNLFYKLPARRKFLRTANTETAHITELFTRLALANCNLEMTLVSNNRQLYNLPANQTINQRITQMFPSQISENLITIESNEKALHLFALVGKPLISKTNNKFQYIFLNSRFIRDKFISHAVKEAYRGIIEPTRFPVIFLFIKMPCEDFDVNVHPTKIEVRFYNANLVHSQILAALREKLLTINSDTAAKIPAQENRRKEISDAMADFFKKHRPTQTQPQFSFNTKTSVSTQSRRPGDIQSETYISEHNLKPLSLDTSKPLPNVVQIHNSYLIVEDQDGFVIIDQHALHERIIYENLRKRISIGPLESQKLLIPESFQLTSSQADAVKTNSQIFQKLGIELAPFGPNTMAVQAFPTLLTKAPILDVINDLLDLLSDKNISSDAETLLDEVLNMAACKAAVKAGQKLTNSEIAQLLADKESYEYSGRCPHGRPTTIKFSLSQLEKQFKRT